MQLVCKVNLCLQICKLCENHMSEKRRFVHMFYTLFSTTDNIIAIYNTSAKSTWLTDEYENSYECLNRTFRTNV